MNISCVFDGLKTEGDVLWTLMVPIQKALMLKCKCKEGQTE